MHVRRLLVLILVFLTSCCGGRIARAADDPDALVQCTLATLDLREKVGQIMMVSIDGTRTTRHMQNLLRAWRPGGIVLFSRNVGTAADLHGLIAGMQQTAPLPLLVATDQEGGPVVRIQVGLTPLPSPAYYGRLGSSDRLFADTQSQGLALRRLGINLNLAPVVDVRDVKASAIGDRSFGPDPALDAALVRAAIRGYQSAGIGATAKHFLGLGEVPENADLTLPVVNVSRATLEARDMVPMRAAIAVDVAALMVTRVVIPALDPTRTTAYASAPIVQGIIRGELGYKGAIITDSLLSPAVLAGPGPTTAALAALRAGDDILLLGTGTAVGEPQIAGAIQAVAEAVALGRIPLSRLDDAVSHVLRLKVRLGLLTHCP
jgi:beta-N-acetylhexosaminidase